jgi:hypothetical protein
MGSRSWSPGSDVAVGFDVDRELSRVFGDGVRPLRFEEALFEAVLEGWVRQQRARLLSEATIRPRVALVRRLLAHSNRWPWEWRAEDVEEWIEDLAIGPSGLHISTLRSYQIAIRAVLRVRAGSPLRVGGDLPRAARGGAAADR